MLDMTIHVGDTVDIRAKIDKTGLRGIVQFISPDELFHVEIVKGKCASETRIYNKGDIFKRHHCRFCKCLLPYKTVNDDDMCDSFKCFLAEARERPIIESEYDQ